MADKHHETLDAMLQAYEARLKPLETLEERWRQYPDPQIQSKEDGSLPETCRDHSSPYGGKQKDASS